jgi:hypothetical protein
VRRTWIAGASAACAASAAAVATATAGGVPAPSVSLSGTLPSVVRQGGQLVVRGRTDLMRPTTQAALQLRRSGRFGTVAAGAVGAHGRFTIRWQVPSSQAIGPVSLRVAIRRRRHTLVHTPAVQSAIGSAPALCATPVPPAVEIPVGSGWIVGGRYNEGGAFPGIYACDSEPYTVTATDSGGVVQGSQAVAGGHSYTLVVPAGTYTLKSDFCQGSATVAAGRQTMADTVCPVP